MHHVDQDFYMSKIEQILSNTESSKYAPMRMKLSWLANTWPDTVFEISQTAQATRSMYKKNIGKHLQHINKETEYVHDHKVSIRIPKLDYSSLRITAYSDAALANNADFSSQLGQMVSWLTISIAL